MKCHYINLDDATGRRANLEAAYQAVNPPASWELVRIAASGPDAASGLGGTASLPEKACWLSHRRAIEASLDDDGAVLVVEDDVRFSPRTFYILGALAEADTEWDILFTDVILTNADSMVSFARDWPQLARAGNFRLLDLAEIPYVGAAGYVIRNAAKRKVLAALDSLPSFDRAYDVALADLIRGGALVGRGVFPFLTAPSADADASTIQPSRLQLRERMINAFRRLMFVDRDLDASRAEIAALEAVHADPAAVLIGGVFATMVSTTLTEG
jgi:GR25 family glycosyltransferase involved in LPS biosynthesis